MDSYMDMDNPIHPFSINADIIDMDIYDFSTKSTVIEKAVSGTGNANIKLKGSFVATNSLLGKSWIEIKNANLWETSLFKGLGTVLFIPNLKEVIFTDAFGALQIKNSRFYTENFKLVSREMEFITKGSLEFNNKVYAVIKIRLKKELIQESAWLSKISSLLLESAGWFVGNIKVSGNIQDPVFTVTPVGVGNILDKVKKTINKVLDVLK